ncbi:glycerophosphodiester phosphodiesterase family protein [uncultured Amnibacterium sp.]|uniref:glycerophosphodiester phosphodiesterase family protein n=1 Tax=uncultured Amnibacterium sp. TaxID=1631851 RepID=UPI0035CC3D9E
MSAPLVIGHRGAPGYRPEHTRAAFELAIAQGADAVEVDVVPTRDGQLVVRHDAGLAGTTDVAAHPQFADRRTVRTVDGKRVRDWFADDLDWAELQQLRARERLPRLRPGSAAHDGEEGILRLADVLRIARDGGVRTVVELKHATAFAERGLPLDELLAAEVPPGDRGDTIVESFEQQVLRDLARRGWSAPLISLMKAWGTPPDSETTYRDQRRDLAGFAGFAGLSVHTSLARRSLVERAGAHGLDVWVWTLRPENAFLPPRHWSVGGPATHGNYARHWREIAVSGVAGVFTDHPDLARAAFASTPSRV